MDRRTSLIARIKAKCLVEDTGHSSPCWVWQGGHSGSVSYAHVSMLTPLFKACTEFISTTVYRYTRPIVPKYLIRKYFP